MSNHNLSSAENRSQSIVNDTVTWGALGLLGACAALLCSSAQANSDGRPWTPRDSIAVRYFVDHQEAAATWARSPGKSILISSDGRYFFFVSRHGDVSCDCNIYQLQVFAMATVRRSLGGRTASGGKSPAPLQELTFRSSSNVPAIGQARWEDGTDSILFVGVSDSGRAKGFRLDVRSGALEALTREADDITVFEARGKGIIYQTTIREERREVLDEYPTVVIEGNELESVIFPGHVTSYVTRMFASYDGSEPLTIPSPSYAFGGPWLSPDGRKAVVAQVVREQSPKWDYFVSDTKASGKRVRSLAQFVLVDMQTGAVQPMLDAPIGGGNPELGGRSVLPQVLWAPDSTEAILVNTYVPATPDAKSKGVTPVAQLVAYEVTSNRWDILEPVASRDAADSREHTEQVVGVSWLVPGRELLVEHATRNKTNTSLIFRRQHSRWYLRTKMAGVWSRHVSQPRQPFLFIKESANDAPEVVAMDGERQIVLTKPDPALQGVYRARLEPITWQESDGSTVTGGLMLPRGARPASGWPLIVQAYHYVPDRFLPDGPFPTAYAAQSLVALGMAVLEINIQDLPGVRTTREGAAFVQRIDAAVGSLSDRDVVDRNKVGLVGFSRAGFLTYHAITHPGRIGIAAAVVADAWTGSYTQYLTYAATSISGEEHEIYYGASFWSNKKEWLEEESSFNVDHVRTPVLFATNGTINALAAMDTVGAFRLNKRPFEYLLFPKGTHQLVRARERFESLDATVDWMAFWILGRESPDATKASRYVRWRRLREASTQAGTTEASGLR